MKKISIWLIVSILVTLGFLRHFSRGGSIERHQEITALFLKISNNPSKKSLETALRDSRVLLVRFLKDGNWLVSEQMRILGDYWVVWIEFSGEDIASAKIRWADGKDLHPVEAPTDFVNKSGKQLQ